MSSLLFGSMVASSLTVVSLVVLLMAWMAVRGTLTLNSTFGIRTAATKSSPQAWDAAHRATAGASRGLGFTGLAIAAALVILGATQSLTVVVTAAVVGYLLVVVLLIRLVLLANRAAMRG